MNGMQLFDSSKKKGQVGGLNIFLQVIVMVFVIGIIVMAFVLTGSTLKASTTDADAQLVIGNTTESLSGVSDWFPIFITIAAVVALILLIVLIIISLRGAGLMGGGGA